jgi:Asp-tRNA(Asn)/Glu-tRNA(Gln) amidotransferase A subunit family amidase
MNRRDADTETDMDERQSAINRRRFIECFSAAGLGSALLPGALAAVAQDAATITIDMVRDAQRIAGVSFTPDEQWRLLEKLNGARGYIAGFERLRAANLGSPQPAIVFNPVPPGKKLPTEWRPMRRAAIDASMPASDEQLAFLPLTHLAKLVETRQVTPTDLTKLYLARLKKYDPQLHCVVNLTEELALRQARQADQEIAAGNYRGPLHGIPYGLKDLFAVRGVKTTWGMTPFKNRIVDADATVYSKLSKAGAILIAKLSTGAIAVTAQWFGGLTRNPWNTEQDASGSSAGPGSATAAGLVGFSIGSDTGGSIIQPSTRNGVSGLRPTFGRVSRYGGMTLAWTQDTVGPMCRSAEDCALVLEAICGPDGKDNTIIDVPFNWDASADVATLRVGYLRAGDGPIDEETRGNNDNALRVIRSLGITPVPFALPDVPIEAIDFIRYAETSAAFDEETRAGVLRQTEEGPEQSRRPDEIRAGRFIPAVEFIQANRFRMRVMEQVDAALGDLDLFIGSNQALTNRTGHPVMSIPNGFSKASPTALHLTGKLFGEQQLLLLAHAFQAKTDFHTRHPRI